MRANGRALQLFGYKADELIGHPVEQLVPEEARGTLATAAIRDVSERLAHEAERERLRAVTEAERVERRLQQSQRLESLGQLVGGVARDFNYLLNVIQGYADLTAGAAQLLRRTLGEHIKLTIAPEPALWRVKADRGQLEQVLVNLAVNARDAMPGEERPRQIHFCRDQVTPRKASAFCAIRVLCLID